MSIQISLSRSEGLFQIQMQTFVTVEMHKNAADILTHTFLSSDWQFTVRREFITISAKIGYH